MKSDSLKTAEVAQAEPKFLNRVSIYGVEFAVAMVTIIILASVLSFSLYALFNLVHDISGNGAAGYGALWAAASAIIWLPVFFIFYARSRNYMDRHPETHNNDMQRGFVVAYQIVMVLAIISFAFAAVYSLFMALINTKDVVEPLVTVTLPSVLSMLVFAGAYVAFFRRPVLARKAYLLAVSGLTGLIIIPTIILSIIALRDYNSTINANDNYHKDRSYSEDYRYDDYRYDSDSSYQ